MLARCWLTAGVVLGVTVSSTSAARAQGAEAISALSTEYAPSTAGPNPRQRVGTSVVRANVGYPVVLRGGWVLLPSVSYERLTFRTEGLPVAPHSLHAPLLTAGVLRVFSPRLFGILSVSGGFAGNLERAIRADDLVVTGMVLGMYRIHDNLTLGAGLGYDRRTGRLQPLPALPLAWRITPRWQVRGVVPSFVAGEYRTASWLTTGLRASFDGNRYHLDAPRFGGEDVQLAYSVVSAGPRLTAHLGSLVHLDLYSNVPVLRRYATYRDDEKLSSTYLKPVVTFGARLWLGLDPWRPPEPARKRPRRGPARPARRARLAVARALRGRSSGTT